MAHKEGRIYWKNYSTFFFAQPIIVLAKPESCHLSTKRRRSISSIGFPIIKFAKKTITESNLRIATTINDKQQTYRNDQNKW